MKVLFLDFDGVIRLAIDREWSGAWTMKFCPNRIAMLAQVCVRTGCKVVLTTDWRWCQEEDPRAFLGPLRPFLHDDWRTACKGHRWIEIEHWLDTHPGIADFAILDDVASLFEGAPSSISSRLMLCTSRFGLVPTHYNNLIRQFS